MEGRDLEKTHEETARPEEGLGENGHADAKRQDKSPAPITPETLQTRILDLEAIVQSRDTPVLYREQLAELVERPLLSACEELYDKNIVTLSTSANKQNVEFNDPEHPEQKRPGGGAYIIIDFDALSAKNQEIGRSLGEVYGVGSKRNLRIVIPLTRESTFEEVQTKAEEIAHKFAKQRYRAVTGTLEQVRQLFGFEPNDESMQPEDFANGYYWSAEQKVFFLSKEQYEKAMEKVDE